MFLESMKKPFFISLIASVFLAACWGIVIVLLGRFSLFETRILMTTLIVAAGSLGGLACSTGLRKQSRFGQDRFIEITAYVGTGLSFAAALLGLLLVWTDGFNPFAWQVNAVLVVFSIASCHLVLLSLARLDRRFQWLQYLARVCILALASLLGTMILAADSFFIGIQGLAVLTIFVAAMTTAIPLMHKLYPADRGDLVSYQADENLQIIDAEIYELKARISELEEKRAKLLRGS